MYSRGTSALKKEYFTFETSDKKKTKSVGNKMPAQSIKKRRLLLKKRAVAGVLALAAMAFIILFRYAAITSEFNVLTKKRSRLSLVEAQVVEMQMIAESNVDQKRIEQEAQRLGLKQPAKSQIKYISLGNTDNGEVLKTEKTNALSAFINRVSVILDYLY